MQGLIAPAAPSALPPSGGRSAPPTPGDFPVAGKVTKGAPGEHPWTPEGDASLPLRFPHPLDRVSATKIDRFATLSWWANRSFFLPKLHRGHTLSCQSVARQVGLAFACCPEWHPFLGEATLALLGG